MPHFVGEPGLPGILDGIDASIDSLTMAVNTKIDESAAVHLTGNETIAGTKTFSSAPSVPDASFTQAKVSGLTTALATKQAKDVIVYHFRDHGGTPDYNASTRTGTDNGPALQALIDLAQQNVVNGLTGAPIIDMGPGAYAIATAITLKSASLKGSAMVNGTMIYWTGSTSDTAFTKSQAYPGGSSYSFIEDISFWCPASADFTWTNEPACWLDLSGGVADVGLRLDDVSFQGAVTQVKVGQVVNCHWNNVRFDGWSGYALTITPPNSTAFLGSFVLDKFTCDNHRAVSGSTSSLGVFKIDNTAGATNLGTYSFRNARIELNSDITATGKAIWQRVEDTSNLDLDNISVQGVGGHTADNLVYLTAASAFTLPGITMRAVRASGVTNYWSGNNLTSAFPRLATRGNLGLLAVGQGGPNTSDGQANVVTQDLTVLAYQGATQPPFAIRNAADGTNNRLTVDPVGVINWGGGAGATDANLYRDATNSIRTDGSLVIGSKLKHLGGQVGFFNTTSAAKQTVSGSRGGNAALQSLLTALATYGLITDSTSA